MKIGDHLVSGRGLYSHHGLYVGNGKIIHYAGLSQGFDKERIELTTLQKFENGKKSQIENHLISFYNADERAERAHSKIGENSYNVIFNNCEHFVNWCFDGFRSSSQLGGGNLSDATKNLATAGAMVLVPGVAPIIAAASLSDTKKKLATVGAIVLVPGIAPILATGYIGKKIFKWLVD